uniref:Beta-galactosidase n=1 Tax=Phytophthora ramorum TaxID=164328 RepID=H3HE36_PHYRM
MNEKQLQARVFHCVHVEQRLLSAWMEYLRARKQKKVALAFNTGKVNRAMFGFWKHRAHVLQQMRKMFLYQESFRAQTHFGAWKRYLLTRKQMNERLRKAMRFRSNLRKAHVWQKWNAWVSIQRQERETIQLAVAFRQRFFSRKSFAVWRKRAAYWRRKRALANQALRHYQERLVCRSLQSFVDWRQSIKRLARLQRELAALLIEKRKRLAISTLRALCAETNRKQALAKQACRHWQRYHQLKYWGCAMQWFRVAQHRKLQGIQADAFARTNLLRRCLAAVRVHIVHVKQVKARVDAFRCRFFRSVADDCFFQWRAFATFKQKLRVLRRKTLQSERRQRLQHWHLITVEQARRRTRMQQIAAKRRQRELLCWFNHWESVCTDLWLEKELVTHHQRHAHKRRLLRCGINALSAQLPARHERQKCSRFFLQHHRHFIIQILQQWRQATSTYKMFSDYERLPVDARASPRPRRRTHRMDIALLSVLLFVACFIGVRPPALRSQKPLLTPNKSHFLTVTYSPRGFEIDGKRTLLLGGSIHYPRSSAGQWEQLLREAKRDGLNHVEMYVFWNLHEQERGVWNFADNANITRFYELAADVGLFLHVRFGPYVCAEWSNGGLPVWLNWVPGMKMRSSNGPWQREMERFITYMVELSRPFLAKNGGPIIMAQIENEFAWHDPQYIEWCGELVKRLDTSIPWIMCYANAAENTILSCNDNDCVDFAVKHVKERPSDPLVWTEDEGWFQTWQKNKNNPLPNDQRTPEDMAYAVARWFAVGGAAHNYYMYHGGNNYGRAASAGVTTMYADGVNLHADGLSNEPKRSHLRKLHEALIECNDVLMSNDRQLLHPHELPLVDEQAIEASAEQRAFIYGPEDGPNRVAFLENLAAEGQQWTMYPGLVGEQLEIYYPQWADSVPWALVPRASEDTTVDGQQSSILLDCLGLTRGRAYINGHDLGRYWLINDEGDFVQRYYHIPRDWLLKDQENLLLVFDELGGSVASVRVVTSTLVAEAAAIEIGTSATDFATSNESSVVAVSRE